MEEQRRNELARILMGERDKELDATLFRSVSPLKTEYKKMITYFQSCNSTTTYDAAAFFGQQSPVLLAQYQSSAQGAINMISQFMARLGAISPTDNNFSVRLHSEMFLVDPNTQLQTAGIFAYTFSWLIQPVITVQSGDKYRRPVLAFPPPTLPVGTSLFNPAYATQYTYMIASLFKQYVYPSQSTASLLILAQRLVQLEKDVASIITASNLDPNSWQGITLADLERSCPNTMRKNGTGWQEYLSNIGWSNETLDRARETSYNGTETIIANQVTAESHMILIPSKAYMVQMDNIIGKTNGTILTDYAKLIGLFDLGLLVQLHGVALSGLTFSGFPVGQSGMTTAFRSDQANWRKQWPERKSRRMDKPFRMPQMNRTQEQQPIWEVMQDVGMESLQTFDKGQKRNFASQSQALIHLECMNDAIVKFPTLLGRIYYELVMPSELLNYNLTFMTNSTCQVSLYNKFKFILKLAQFAY
jgi:lambda repressor-like predicted transcriptional regulator